MLGAELSGKLGSLRLGGCCSQGLTGFFGQRQLCKLWNLSLALATSNLGGKSRGRKEIILWEEISEGGPFAKGFEGWLGVHWLEKGRQRASQV